MIDRAKHSPIHNYAGVPGLTSWLISESMLGKICKIRLFECSRNHVEPIIPHNHRFDFECIVLEGAVTNRVWKPYDGTGEPGDEYEEVTLQYSGKPGQYIKEETNIVTRWKYEDLKYGPGETYQMKAVEFHSIYFSAGAKVLFFEGETLRDFSSILEPVVDGSTIPTFKVEDWMFQRGKL